MLGNNEKMRLEWKRKNLCQAEVSKRKIGNKTRQG